MDGVRPWPSAQRPGPLLLGGRPSSAGGAKRVRGGTGSNRDERRSCDLPEDANGTFAICAYDKQAHRLTLASDSLGARPLYYAESDGQLYFATSIDALARLDGVPRTHDLATYVEEDALCYPLGRRTKYVGVSVVVDSEAVTAADGAVHCARYYDWRSLRRRANPSTSLAAHCRGALRQAVDSRAPPGARQICLLSGGLDSRVPGGGTG